MGSRSGSRLGIAALLNVVLVLAPRAEEAGPAAPAGPALTVGVPEGAGPAAGFDRALFADLAHEAGYDVAFAALSPEAALADLDAGRIDVAAGPYPAGAAAARRAALPAVLTEGDVLLKRRGDGSLKAPADAAGKRLGLLGRPGDAARLGAAAAALRARVAVRPGAFGHEPEHEMEAGHVAALVGALPDAAAAVLARPEAVEVVGPPFGPVRRLAPLLRADRPELAARLEAALARMRADGRLAALQQRWYGLALDPPLPQPPPVSTSKP